jgi:hypothetical protein
MRKTLALKAVPKGPAAEPSKKKREQINCIETPPNPDWFVRTRERGRTVWYLRFIVTGMLPRRFGPFASRHKALLALDAMLDTLEELIWNLNDPAGEFRLKRRFQLNSDPVIEDAIALPKGGR